VQPLTGQGLGGGDPPGHRVPNRRDYGSGSIG
jgi:hypothetical protein